jgi:hypothetical protein
MPTTIRNTDILFNDATTQSTAAIINTTNVLNATAGASAGAVGTYAFARRAADLAFGATVAGSNLNPTSAGYAIQDSSSAGAVASLTLGTALSGTWRAMGTNTATASNPCGGFPTISGATLYLRIS